MTLVHHNPAGVPRNPAFSQAVSVEGRARTIYVGGQNGVAPDGAIVSDEIGPQTVRALENLETVLAAAGAGLENVVTWSISIVEGQSAAEAFAAFRGAWGDRANPPAISLAFVSGLANPGFLVEISATAAMGADG